MVIAERSITTLLGMNASRGKGVYRANPKSKFLLNVINPAIYSGSKQAVYEGKSSYKFTDLSKNLRVWFRIIMGCIYYRPASSSSNYVNSNKKYFMYYLMKGEKIHLPSILFNYLRNSIIEIRNSETGKSKKDYIPLGRLLSDFLIENGFKDHLTKLNLLEDIVVEIGKPSNGNNLKSTSIRNLGLWSNQAFLWTFKA